MEKRLKKITYQVSREIEFSYGHRLLDYEGKCRHLHGHNGKAVVTLEGTELDGSGMLADFGEIKRKIQEWIEENLDHSVILHRKDPLVKILSELGEKIFLTDSSPTAETIARIILEQALKQGLPAVKVQLWESASCYATCELPRKNVSN